MMRLLRMTLLSIGLAGCGAGDPNSIPAVPVKGHVTFEGRPLEKGTIILAPEVGHPAVGTIVDGRFTLGTYAKDDGAVPGVHRVGIISVADKDLPGGEAVLEAILPEHFASPETSGLVERIGPEGELDLQITLRNVRKP